MNDGFCACAECVHVYKSGCVAHVCVCVSLCSCIQYVSKASEEQG